MKILVKARWINHAEKVEEALESHVTLPDSTPLETVEAHAQNLAQILNIEIHKDRNDEDEPWKKDQ